MTGSRLVGTPLRAGGVVVAFSTRHGGTSAGAFASLNLGAAAGDEEAAVRANRRMLARAVGFDPARAASLAQVHGACVHEVGPHGGQGTFTGDLDGVAEADALVTSSPGVALLAMGADCPVIAAWSAAGDRVGAIHAGWRGLLQGVVQAGVRQVGRGGGGVRALIGPHVGPCCYPVDAGLRRAMCDMFGAGATRGMAVDLGACAERALVQAGVHPDHVARAGGCTSCDADRFFSYRRDGAATGRQACVVMIAEGR